MKIDINGDISDISSMLLSSERYALGRMTYIVEWTCSFISKNLHLITEGNKKVMIRDIEQTLEDRQYGGECDKQEWLKLLNVLKKEVVTNEKRETEGTKKGKESQSREAK